MFLHSCRWRGFLHDPWIEQDAVAAHLARGSANHGKAHPLQYARAPGRELFVLSRRYRPHSHL